jgi:DegV family protein with EDD domain
MTSKASGAYQAACIAQSMLEEQMPDLRVEVIDTRNAALCQGWMAIEAARAALSGLGLYKVAAKVRAMIPVSHLLQTADTLRYLYMGGRIGKAKNLVGSLLNIKPLIGVEDGEIVPLGIARSRTQAYQAMVDKIEAVVGNSRIKIAYVHAGAKQEVAKIKNIVEGRLSAVESIIGELSPALAVHTGPGTAGLCYFPAEIREFTPK